MADAPVASGAHPKVDRAEAFCWRSRRRRAAIAVIETRATFTHAAVPALSDDVYVRGTLTNMGTHLLLPGAASIFVGPDHVGPTRLKAVAPGGTFEVYFGIDHALSVVRTLLAKKTTKTGLLGGGRRTSYDYRVEIDNGTGRAVRCELWDRIPVSRSDQVKIELIDPSRPLATDYEYLTRDEPRGLLKRVLSLSPTARDANALAVTWGVTIARPKDLRMTPLPE